MATNINAHSTETKTTHSSLSSLVSTNHPNLVRTSHPCLVNPSHPNIFAVRTNPHYYRFLSETAILKYIHEVNSTHDFRFRWDTGSDPNPNPNFNRKFYNLKSWQTSKYFINGDKGEYTLRFFFYEFRPDQIHNFYQNTFKKSARLLIANVTFRVTAQGYEVNDKIYSTLQELINSEYQLQFIARNSHNQFINGAHNKVSFWQLIASQNSLYSWTWTSNFLQKMFFEQNIDNLMQNKNTQSKDFEHSIILNDYFKDELHIGVSQFLHLEKSFQLSYIIRLLVALSNNHALNDWDCRSLITHDEPLIHLYSREMNNQRAIKLFLLIMLSNAIYHHKHLKKLDLSHNFIRGYDPRLFGQIAQSLLANPNLTTLNISNTGIGFLYEHNDDKHGDSHQWVAFVRMVAHHPALNELNITCSSLNNLPKWKWDLLFLALEQNPHLTYLNISASGLFGYADVDALYNPNRPTREDILCRNIMKNKTLTRLGLNFAYIPAKLLCHHYIVKFHFRQTSLPRIFDPSLYFDIIRSKSIIEISFDDQDDFPNYNDSLVYNISRVSDSLCHNPHSYNTLQISSFPSDEPDGYRRRYIAPVKNQFPFTYFSKHSLEKHIKYNNLFSLTFALAHLFVTKQSSRDIMKQILSFFDKKAGLIADSIDDALLQALIPQINAHNTKKNAQKMLTTNKMLPTNNLTTEHKVSQEIRQPSSDIGCILLSECNELSDACKMLSAFNKYSNNNASEQFAPILQCVTTEMQIVLRNEQLLELAAALDSHRLTLCLNTDGTNSLAGYTFALHARDTDKIIISDIQFGQVSLSSPNFKKFQKNGVFNSLEAFLNAIENKINENNPKQKPKPRRLTLINDYAYLCSQELIDLYNTDYDNESLLNPNTLMEGFSFTASLLEDICICFYDQYYPKTSLDEFCDRLSFFKGDYIRFEGAAFTKLANLGFSDDFDDHSLFENICRAILFNTINALVFYEANFMSLLPNPFTLFCELLRDKAVDAHLLNCKLDEMSLPLFKRLCDSLFSVTTATQLIIENEKPFSEAHFNILLASLKENKNSHPVYIKPLTDKQALLLQKTHLPEGYRRYAPPYLLLQTLSKNPKPIIPFFPKPIIPFFKDVTQRAVRSFVEQQQRTRTHLPYFQNLPSHLTLNKEAKSDAPNTEWQNSPRFITYRKPNFILSMFEYHVNWENASSTPEFGVYELTFCITAQGKYVVRSEWPVPTKHERVIVYSFLNEFIKKEYEYSEYYDPNKNPSGNRVSVQSLHDMNTTLEALRKKP